MPKVFEIVDFSTMSNDIKRRLTDYVVSIGLFTGSQKFRVATPESDWDYVLTHEDLYRAFNIMGVNIGHIEYSDYAELFSSIKYKNLNREINLILVEGEREVWAWEYATSIVHFSELKNDPISRKKLFGSSLLQHYRDFCEDADILELAEEAWS